MSVTAPDIPITQLAQDAYDYLEPVSGQDAANGWVLMILCAGLGEAFRQVEEVCRSTVHAEPYQDTYDVATCPDWLLGWLGQFVGVPWVAYTDAAAKRTQVQAEAGFYRGSIDTLEAAVTATQTAPNRVTVQERVPDAWGITVAYDPAYTPNPTATQQAAAAATAWGLALSVVSNSQPFFEQASPTKTFESVASTVTFESAVLSDLT